MVSNSGWGEYSYNKREFLYKTNDYRIKEVKDRSKMIEEQNRQKFSFLIKKWDIYREKVSILYLLKLICLKYF